MCCYIQTEHDRRDQRISMRALTDHAHPSYPSRNDNLIMYKSDLYRALSGIQPPRGGTIIQILRAVEAATPKLFSTLADLVSSNSAKLASASSLANQHLSAVSTTLSQISPSAVAIELHEFSRKLDETMAEFAEIREFLLPARQALSELSGAFDVVLQQSRRASSLVQLIEPCLQLSVCLRNYEGLAESLQKYGEQVPPIDSNAVIEFAEVSSIEEIARQFEALSTLTSATEHFFANHVDSDGSDSMIVVRSIETGSPIRISIFGNSKVVQMLLSMIKDASRLAYLRSTDHGRAIQSMETYAKAKELGIESEEALNELKSAIIIATKAYSRSLNGREGGISIDGHAVGAPTGTLEHMPQRISSERPIPDPE